MKNKNQNGRRETRPAFIEPIPFPDEITHLEMINQKLDTALLEAANSVNQIDKDYMAAKRYMAEYRGEIDPHEMFQNELALKQIDRTGNLAVDIWSRLSKQKKSPYFGRIDFISNHTHMKNDYSPEVYYIGAFTFRDKDELLIFDWRAPVAGMFYDCEIGSAGYEAPNGRIEGELTRKRQFKVRDGVMEYALETSVNIQDDVLQRELSHTSDEKMKSIISTIQKEQNQIIRNEKAGTMIIQGVAGSGKTSIALHRIAFLLYRFRETLSARNITILSPNKVFGDYISTVLPELGEESICELGFSDIAEVQLEGVIAFEPDKDPLETADRAWAERVRYKSTLEFVKKMELYVQEVPKFMFEPAEYTFGRFTATAEWIQKRFDAYQTYPIKKRIEMITDDIYEQFESDNFMEDELPRKGAIRKSLNTMLKIKNSLALYKQFYKWLGQSDLFVMPARQTLEWMDVYPFLYVHAAFAGLKESRGIKHLVIDEMQDYTPIQYAVINQLFSCEKTILGDFGQFINPNHLHGLSDLQHIYEDAYLVELNKSYRSTYEIITFANDIQQVEKLQPMERHGEVPQVFSCKDAEEETDRITEQIENFLNSKNVSMGIILKTNREAQNLYQKLADTYEIHLISYDSTQFVNGISVTSIQMSKGLEFDEVLIPNVNNDIYYSEYDRSLLYIAATRAMHRLTLLYTGSPTCLLPDALIFSHKE